MLERLVIFRPVIMRQLQNRPKHLPRIPFRNTRCQIIQGKIIKQQLLHQSHTQALIKRNTLLIILHPNHRLGQIKVVLNTTTRRSLHQFHPITIGIVRERQSLHTTLVRFLLERHTRRDEFIRRSVRIVTVERHVSEPVLVFVPGVVREVAFVFRAVIMRQFERHAVHGPEVIVRVLGSGREVVRFAFGECGEEVEGEFVLGEIEFVDEGHAH
mmetsp:Transcript_8244/g.10152  ORF Transcript_8244/g.10152 Transcript_8244/m.10152 type:complete len:213 (+) Transcript_8244:441-1079(+)